MNNPNENQHFVSKVLLERFKIPGNPLQCYQAQTGEWIHGVQCRKDPVERVVTGNAVAQREKCFEPVFLGLAEVLHVVEGFARAEQRADDDGQHVNQFVILRALDARVGQVFEIGVASDSK